LSAGAKEQACQDVKAGGTEMDTAATYAEVDSTTDAGNGNAKEMSRQAEDGKRQELVMWLQKVAEVLWWGGGEPFRESVKNDTEDTDLMKLCTKFLNAQ
jgi:hypothetical protein